jgi:hypothetical protein
MTSGWIDPAGTNGIKPWIKYWLLYAYQYFLSSYGVEDDFAGENFSESLMRELK